MKIEDIRFGDNYYWKHTLKGGYGYSEYLTCYIRDIRISTHRIKIQVLCKNGRYRDIWVKPESIIEK